MSNPKSAYNIPTKKSKSGTHIIVVWVDNEAGVLARVVGLFSGRGYNIESLAVAEIDATKNIIQEMFKSNPQISADDVIDFKTLNYRMNMERSIIDKLDNYPNKYNFN